jgi:hypothetical protein
MTTNTKYFKIEQKNKLENVPADLNYGFSNDTYLFYNMPQSVLFPVDIVEDNELDIEEDNESNLELESELKVVKQKMEILAQSLVKNGYILISSEEYKNEEQKVKDDKKKYLTKDLSPQEKFVYEKTKEFLEEYDIIKPPQKQFMVSLRPCIANGTLISELYLEMHAEDLKKDINKIFTYGEQSAICYFAKKVQLELEDFIGNNKQLKLKF